MANLGFSEADIAEILDECTPRARLLIISLLKYVSKLEQRVVDLEAQLSKNSRNSSKPAAFQRWLRQARADAKSSG